MKILAFETSCDDTSIAIFENDKLISMDTKSQIKIHNKTGGVVPEVAAREHANSIFSVLEKVLKFSKLELESIDYIAVTETPGLIPSLLTGLTVARTLGNILDIPVIPINHIEAHIFANFLERKKEDIEFPLVCLTVSGGHNEIYFMESMFSFKKIGGTTDDSAGEAFDKVAKMMGLEYPGGPIISKLAEEYSNSPSLPGRGLGGGFFPRVWLKKQEFDFSFSGLKSAVKREIEKRVEMYCNTSLQEKDIQEISYEFENAVTEVLAFKLVNAAKQKGVNTVMLAGGVSANNKLKELISVMAKKENLEFFHPVKNEYCMDNAAMVGINGYYKVIG